MLTNSRVGQLLDAGRVIVENMVESETYDFSQICSGAVAKCGGKKNVPRIYRSWH